MKIVITEDYNELSVRAASVIIDIVKHKPHAVLGLATGTTPLGLYERLIADYRVKGTSYKYVKAVNLRRTPKGTRIKLCLLSKTET